MFTCGLVLYVVKIRCSLDFGTMVLSRDSFMGGEEGWLGWARGGRSCNRKRDDVIWTSIRRHDGAVNTNSGLSMR